MGRNERTSDRMRPHGCTHTLLVRPHEGQNLTDAVDSLPVDVSVTDEAARRPVGGAETRAANRAWWDGEAEDYYADHGSFLGDTAFVWGPEGWTEAELDLLEVRDGMTVLEIGAGAAQCSRWLSRAHARRAGGRQRPVDGHAAHGSPDRGGDAGCRRHRLRVPVAARFPCSSATGSRCRSRDATVDRVFTAYGVVPFVADSAACLP